MTILLAACDISEQAKRNLNSKNHPTTIIDAAYKLGESKDTSAIKLLLADILDNRMSTDIRYKGMTVCYCKLIALKKITGASPPFKLNQFGLDTAAVIFYVQWATRNGIIDKTNNVDINYSQHH